MKLIDNNDKSFKTFNDILTGYRITNLLMTVSKAGLFDVFNGEKVSGEAICNKLNWDLFTGKRVIECLAELGILVISEEGYSLSPFAEEFFYQDSGSYQGNTLMFENRLHDSWNTLGDVLKTGERVYSSEEKSQESYLKDLNLYIDSMDEAARIRSRELWGSFHEPLPEDGYILEIGAGSGAYIYEFLKLNENFKGIFCDLGDVIDKAKQSPEYLLLKDRIIFINYNFMDETQSTDFLRSDIVLLSNVIHCQGDEETKRLIKIALSALSEHGTIVIHDFFTDRGWRGALYDIHMMLNTYNGKTYSTTEIVNSIKESSNFDILIQDLPSGSSFISARKLP